MPDVAEEALQAAWNHKVAVQEGKAAALPAPAPKELALCKFRKSCRCHRHHQLAAFIFLPSLFSPCLAPNSQLKSLDKKIAKAENGSGTGTEDEAQLKLVSRTETFMIQPPFSLSACFCDSTLCEGALPATLLLFSPHFWVAALLADAKCLVCVRARRRPRS